MRRPPGRRRTRAAPRDIPERGGRDEATMLGFKTRRQWIYEQKVTGRWQRLRKATFALLHLILFVTPWITINGSPALLLDLPNRRLYVLGAIFTAESSIWWPR